MSGTVRSAREKSECEAERSARVTAVRLLEPRTSIASGLDSRLGQTHECAWCDKPVAEAGETCDLECYAFWYAWSYEHGDDHVLVDGSLVTLTEGETMPLDMVEQPWYSRESDRMETE